MALFDAAKRGDTETLSSLLDVGDASSVNSKNENGMSALMLAAMTGHVEALELLLDRGADLELQVTVSSSMSGFTAFIFANGMNQLKAVELLLSRGANINHHTRSGLFALQFSSNKGDLERVRLLIERRADVNLTNSVEGGTALGAADERGFSEIARLLITAGAKLQRHDNGDGNNEAFVHTVTDERSLAFAPIVRAFMNSAGSALLDAIVLSDSAAKEAEELRAADVDRSEATLTLATHAQQLAVVLTSTLSEQQLGELLRCDAGAAAFRHAVATKSILFLARPNVQGAAKNLWLGNLLSALSARRILDREWSVRRRISGVELAGLLVLCVPAAILNCILLVPVAIAPPVENCVIAVLERVGFKGGSLGPQTGRYRAIQAFRWRDFYVLDVACIKLAVRVISLLGTVAISASTQASAARGEARPLLFGGLLATYATALVVELQELAADGYTYYIADPLNPLECAAFAAAVVAISAHLLGLEPSDGGDDAPPLALRDVATPLLSASLGLLTAVQIARTFLISSTLGPLVVMTYRMVADMGKWLQLLSLVVFSFGLTLHSMLRGTDLLSAGHCDDAGGMAGLEEGLLPAVGALFKYAVGAADILELDCLDASPFAMVTMVVYSILSTILLVNMLIAIMAKTFDDIWEQQERNHQMNFAQLALSWHAASVAPPPLSICRLLLSMLGSIGRVLGRACCCCKSPAAEFSALEESTGNGQDMTPTATEAWATAHSEASLLAATDEFLERHSDERAREGKWRTALMRRLGTLEVATRESRRELAQASELLRRLHLEQEERGTVSLGPPPVASTKDPPPPPSTKTLPSPAQPPLSSPPPPPPPLPPPPLQAETSPPAASTVHSTGGVPSVAPRSVAPEAAPPPAQPPAQSTAPAHAAAPMAAPRRPKAESLPQNEPGSTKPNGVAASMRKVDATATDHSVASHVSSQRIERARARSPAVEARLAGAGGGAVAVARSQRERPSGAPKSRAP